MRRALNYARQPSVLRTFHGVMTILWALLIIPSVLFWQNSIVWVVIMSAWANLAGHFASWQSARVEVRQEEQMN